ncbi:MAG: hypothetical protein M5R42_09415 [Rhodocyclaceae bacterium]|nr:hypothetical protein [Rhodocyclaceae bacterium]
MPPACRTRRHRLPGGEENPVDGYVIVRQSDAHAWAEVWLRQGLRVDPTAAIAPERNRA